MSDGITEARRMQKRLAKREEIIEKLLESDTEFAALHRLLKLNVAEYEHYKKEVLRLEKQCNDIIEKFL